MYTKIIDKLSKKIIISVTVAFLFTFALQVYIQNDEKEEKLDIIYNSDLKLINTILEDEKNRLISLGYILASDEKLQKYLKKKKRDQLFKYLNERWDFFDRNLRLNEVHIIDNNGNSFINLVDYDYGEHKDTGKYNVFNFRKDVKKAILKKQPVKTIFICRYFVGIRAIIPIKDENDNIIGAVSLGESLLRLFSKEKNSIDKEILVLIKKGPLKSCLKSDAYRIIISKFTNLKDYVAFGNVEPVFLDTLIEEDKIKTKFIENVEGTNYLFSVYNILDFNGKEIGKTVLISDVNDIISDFYLNIAISILIYLVLLLTILLIINKSKFKLEKKFDEIKEILYKLTEKDFSIIKEYEKEIDGYACNIKDIDDVDILKFNLIRLGIELEEHLKEMSDKVKKYAKDAFVDPLTGALNRRALIKVGENTVENAKIKNIPLSVILIDIDFFKKINDTYGHDVGDIVLKDFVKTVKNIISRRDILVRLGGEEFLIILPGADKKKSIEIAENIRKTIEEKELNIDGKKIKYTISAGVEELKNEDNSIFDVILRADKKLYKAKKTGRNKVIF